MSTTAEDNVETAKDAEVSIIYSMPKDSCVYSHYPQPAGPDSNHQLMGVNLQQILAGFPLADMSILGRPLNFLPHWFERALQECVGGDGAALMDNALAKNAAYLSTVKLHKLLETCNKYPRRVSVVDNALAGLLADTRTTLPANSYLGYAGKGVCGGGNPATLESFKQPTTERIYCTYVQLSDILSRWKDGMAREADKSNNRSAGISGVEEEFRKLNGPSLAENSSLLNLDEINKRSPSAAALVRAIRALVQHPTDSQSIESDCALAKLIDILGLFLKEEIAVRIRASRETAPPDRRVVLSKIVEDLRTIIISVSLRGIDEDDGRSPGVASPEESASTTTIDMPSNADLSLRVSAVEFGRRVRKTRKCMKWTVVKLATKLGVAHPYVVQYEKGRRDPTTRTVKRFAKALGINPKDLID